MLKVKKKNSEFTEWSPQVNFTTASFNRWQWQLWQKSNCKAFERCTPMCRTVLQSPSMRPRNNATFCTSHMVVQANP